MAICFDVTIFQTQKLVRTLTLKKMSNKAKDVQSSSEETQKNTNVDATSIENAAISLNEDQLLNTEEEALVEQQTPTSNTVEGQDSDELHEEEEVVSSEDDDDTDEEEVDYSKLNQEELILAFKDLLVNKKVQNIKPQVDEIKREFDTQLDEELQEKKEAFLASGGNIIDFQFSTPNSYKFNELFAEYRTKRNNYFKNLKKDLQANLEKRLQLIEELKGLINLEESIGTTFKNFKDIQDRWREAGPIPRDGYNMVWNNYHHHVENFYDFIHLNREYRDRDFKQNLDRKLKLISHAEALAQEPNVNKAFKELQMLHRVWKEEIGPVAKEYRDDVWQKFSDATKVIHDKRVEYEKELEQKFEDNLQEKNIIVEQISSIANTNANSHSAWQKAIKQVEALRTAFFELGRVPKSETQKSWKAFKDAVRLFNKNKNQFYKNQKKEQFDNLDKKKELIKIAKANMDSDDFEVVTPLMIKIQDDWKKVGHVPRKDSDKVWKEFKAACNHYFDRLHASKNKASEEEENAFNEKSKILETIKAFELTDNKENDLSYVKETILSWNKLGRVSRNQKAIEGKFNKVVDALLKKLKVGKNEAELLKYENKLNTIVSDSDSKKVTNEHFFISKKISEIEGQIIQLENNLGFFQHVDDSNPLVQEVHKNIQNHKDELKLWKAKYRKLKNVM